MTDFPTAEQLFDATNPAKLNELGKEAMAPQAETAFLVIVHKDGNVEARNDLTQPLTVSRQANVGDFRRACSEVIAEVNVQLTAQATAGQVAMVLQQLAQQQADMEQNARIAAKLQERGIVVPGR